MTRQSGVDRVVVLRAVAGGRRRHGRLPRSASVCDGNRGLPPHTASRRPCQSRPSHKAVGGRRRVAPSARGGRCRAGQPCRQQQLVARGHPKMGQSKPRGRLSRERRRAPRWKWPKRLSPFGQQGHLCGFMARPRHTAADEGPGNGPPTLRYSTEVRNSKAQQGRMAPKMGDERATWRSPRLLRGPQMRTAPLEWFALTGTFLSDAGVAADLAWTAVCHGSFGAPSPATRSARGNTAAEGVLHTPPAATHGPQQPRPTHSYRETVACRQSQLTKALAQRPCLRRRGSSPCCSDA